MVRSFLFALLLISSTVAFAPPSRRNVVTTTTTTTTTTPVITTPLFAGKINDDDVIDMLPLALKFAAVMGIKTVRDVVTYPTLYASNALQKSFTVSSDTSENEVSADDDMNMLVLFFKFMGVMAFKTIHDVIYYPLLYVSKCVSHDDTKHT